MPEEYENLAESEQETIQERHQEARAEGYRPAWLETLAVSTALFAVLAAFASLKARPVFIADQSRAPPRLAATCRAPRPEPRHRMSPMWTAPRHANPSPEPRAPSPAHP